MSPNAENMREQDYPLDKISPDQERAVVAKALLTWDGDAAFWAGELAKGKGNYDSLVGNIFSEGEKTEYARQDKLLLSIPELVPKINALEGMQIAGRREGIIVPVGGEDAPDTEIIGHLVKSIQRKNNLDLELTAAFTDGIVTGYPSWIFFDRVPGDEMNKELEVYHEPWDSVLPDPKFMRREYSDAERLTRVKLMSLDQLKNKYVERRKAIDGHIKGKFTVNPFTDQFSLTAAERDLLFNQINSSSEQLARSGLVYVIERMFFVYIPTTVWVSKYTNQVEILPENWSEPEVNRWIQFHPDYERVQKEMKILWVTTVTSTGLLLENRRHWFQEGEFPAEVYIPRLWNNKVYGVVEFLKGSLKGRNVTKIEHLHSLRMSNDDLMIVTEGALVNPADAAKEKGRTGGILVRKRGSSSEDITFPLNHREQLGWADMSETFLADIDRLSVDRNFEGGVQSSQESGKAIQQRISQTQVKYSPYLSTFNLTNLRTTRKILLMVPYTYTEPQMLAYMDPKSNQPRQVMLNEETEYSWVGEGVARVRNNLSGCRFDYVEAEGDNSITAKEHELAVFNDIMERVARFPQIEFWPALLTSVPNRMAQDFGRKLQQVLDEKAKQPPAPEQMKKSFTIAAKDLIHNPLAIQALANEGIIVLPQAAPGAANPQRGSSPMPQGQPSPTTSPEMAMSAS